jgi:hypothetical protein
MSFLAGPRKRNRGQWFPLADIATSGFLDFAVAEQMRLESSVSPAELSYLLGMGIFVRNLGSLAGLHKSLRKL